MSQPTTAFPDPENWIELPGFTARLYRPGLKPCGQCQSNIKNIVSVKRTISGKPLDPPSFETTVSIECPRCKLASFRKSDVRTLIARLDVARGIVIDLEREYAGAH